MLKYYCLLFFFISCSKNRRPISYVFSNVEIKNGINTGEMPVVSNDTVIIANAYFIRVDLFPVIVDEGTGASVLDETPYNENPLDSILVSSNYDFDGTQVAGVSLNKNFVYYNDSYLNLSPLDEMRVTNSTHDNFLDDPIPKKIDLLLVSPPNLPSYQQFKMKFFFRDGSTKEDSTSKIYLY